MELVIVTIQGLATAGALAAAVAAFRTVRRAEASAHASRQAMLLPAKQEHARQIRELLVHLTRERPLGRPGGAPDLSPVAPSRRWVIEGAANPPISPFTKGNSPSSPPLSRGGAGGFQRQALFDDLETHLPGFKAQWVDVTSQMGRYLSAWNQVTERLTGALTEYFRYQFLDGAGQGLVRNVLLACWLQLYGDPAAERETFADLSIEPSVHGGFMLFRRLPDGPPQRYAFLPSAAELEVVWQRMREFRWSFPEYGSFKQQLGQLRHQYERLEQARESLRQMLRSAESVVVFPEECPLLGGQPVSVPASGKLADERPTIQTHRLSLGYALSPPVSRVPEGGQAAVRRLHDLAAPAGAALLRYLRPARR